MEWSTHQNAVFDFVTNGSGSAIAQAVAGSGKTTTIVEAISRIDPSFSAVFLAFNRSIAKELGQRIPRRYEACTFHSLGMRAWRKWLGSNAVEVDEAKVPRIIKHLLSEENGKRYGAAIAELVGYAKATGLVPGDVAAGLAPVRLVEDTDTAWLDLVEHFGVDLGDDGGTEDTFRKPLSVSELLRYCRRVLAMSIEYANRIVDFDDMLYMPVVAAAPFHRRDFVFVDEVQDTSAVQVAMLRKLITNGGRVVGVGDRHQAIYGFRGADSQAMDAVREAFDAIELPLSVSYRCPKAVVEEARHYVDHIEAAPTAPEGEIKQLDTWTAQTFSKDDAILCRCTAPLVSTAFRLIAQRVPCQVLGRKIGKGLVSLIRKMRADSIDNLEEKLERWSQREIEKAQEQGKESKVDAIRDRVECIRCFIDMLPEGARTVGNLELEIENLFDSDEAKEGVLTLATVHKAKGLEWDTVYVLDRDELMPLRSAKQEWEKAQEVNLLYVALTRAKRTLVDIRTDGFAVEVKR